MGRGIAAKPCIPAPGGTMRNGRKVHVGSHGAGGAVFLQEAPLLPSFSLIWRIRFLRIAKSLRPPILAAAMTPDSDASRSPRASMRTEWHPLSPGELGRLLPEYEVLSLLGRGGMGAVYYAVEKALDRPVALKLLPAELSAEPGFADRFVREARAMALLNHPSIVALYAFGHTTAGHLFFTMEFVEGTTLAAVIRGRGLEPGQALKLGGEICAALATAHRQGVVHRDIKPANVLVDGAGRAKVTDFGLARLLDPTGVESGHTVVGAVLGTPEYMAPEQKRGEAVDARADVFSLGVLLYEMLCGEPPQGAFAAPSRLSGCSEAVDAVVTRAMQPKPEDRYPSALEMEADLAAAGRTIHPLPAAGRPMRLKVGIAAVLLVTFALGGLFLLSRPQGSAIRPGVTVSPSSAAEPWVDVLAALREGAVPAYLGRQGDLSRPEFQSTNLLHEADGTLRAWKEFALLLPGPRPLRVRNQAIRLRFRGDRWTLEVRRSGPADGGPGEGYGLRLERGSSEASLGITTASGFERLKTVPVPAGFDWEGSHTLELRVSGTRLSAVLDGGSLVSLDDARVKEGQLGFWAAAGGVIERLEYAILDAGVVDEFATRFPPMPVTRSVSRENSPGTAWLDVFAALGRNEVGVFAWTPAAPGATPAALGSRGVLRDHVVREPEGRLRFLRDTGVVIPGLETPHLRSQALRVSFQGSQWSLEVRSVRRLPAAPGYVLALDRSATALSLARRHNGGLETIALAPWPTGFDWAAFHTAELRAVGPRLTVWLDEWKLIDVEDRALEDGQMFVWSAAGGVLEQLEYANLDAFDPALPSSEVVTLEGHRYQFIAGPAMGWEQARTRAQNLGGHLVTITSEAEARLVRTLCREALSRVGGGGQVWMGGRRHATGQESWRWITGEPFGFTDWARGSPDSNYPGAVLSLMAGSRAPGWNDFERPFQGTIPVNLYIQGFVIEWEPAP